MADQTPAKLALDLFHAERARAQRQVARGANRADAQRHVARWYGIAALAGADLPADLQPWIVIYPPGAEPRRACWTDHAPTAMPAADWHRELADELRRAALSALRRTEQPAAKPADLSRARALLALDALLTPAASLPPITPEPLKDAA